MKQARHETLPLLHTPVHAQELLPFPTERLRHQLRYLQVELGVDYVPYFAAGHFLLILYGVAVRVHGDVMATHFFGARSVASQVEVEGIGQVNDGGLSGEGFHVYSEFVPGGQFVGYPEQEGSRVALFAILRDVAQDLVGCVIRFLGCQLLVVGRTRLNFDSKFFPWFALVLSRVSMCIYMNDKQTCKGFFSPIVILDVICKEVTAL